MIAKSASYCCPTHSFEAPHGEEVCHHGAEAGGEAGLGDEAKLELGQADHVVTLLPVPRGDVQQVRLHQWSIISGLELN